MLTGLLLINLYAKANFSPSYWDKLLQGLARPWSLEAHVDLAQAFWQAGAGQAAKTELVFASSLKSLASSGFSVLGTSSADPEILLKDWQNLPSVLRSRYRFWQNVAVEKPNYRDAYLTLAALAYQQSRFREAEFNLNQALAIDPNSALAERLAGWLSGK